MKAIVINNSGEHLKEPYKYLRGLKVTIIKYIELQGELFAICLTSRGYFKPIKLIDLGEGHELSGY
jgi:hypothetical protein